MLTTLLSGPLTLVRKQIVPPSNPKIFAMYKTTYVFFRQFRKSHNEHQPDEIIKISLEDHTFLLFAFVFDPQQNCDQK